MERKDTDVITLRNHKGEEKTLTRGEYHNAARHASDNYQKDNRPEPSTPQDRQFHIRDIRDRSGKIVQQFQ